MSSSNQASRTVAGRIPWRRSAHPTPPTSTSRDDSLDCEQLNLSDTMLQEMMDRPQAALAALVAPSPQQDTTQAPANLQQFAKNPNGAGMWRAWTRSFNTPLLALLDLFDNAIDASLKVFSERRRYIPLIQAQTDDYEQSGLVLRNSSVKRIPPLSEVLQVYSSNKNQESIGENGVGVKQAAASLSDLTFFMTRNGDIFELGFLMASLQQEEEGLVAPEYIFETGDMEPQLMELAVRHPTVYGEAFRAYGNGYLKLGVDHLLRHFREIESGKDWSSFDHVFCVLMPQLRHGAGSRKVGDAELFDLSSEGDSYKIRTSRMLEDLAASLPKTYIHCQELHVYINKKMVDFHYWEKRLVELTEFTIKVDPENPWHSSQDWKNPKKADTMRIFCGFDPDRCRNNKSSGAAYSLYIYSRASGRLIKLLGDARADLRLTGGGSDYCQGLTILLDDYEGTLPLNPTKQDISFGMEEHGQVKKENLYSWIAAVSHFFWYMQKDAFGLKADISSAVASCYEACQDLDKVEPLGSGDFNRYEDVVWRNVMGKIRSSNRARCKKMMGDDTAVPLDAPEKPHTVKLASRKRSNTQRRNKVRSSLDADLSSDEDDTYEEAMLPPNATHHAEEVKRLQKLVKEGEDSRAHLLRVKAVQGERIQELMEKTEEEAAAQSKWRSKKTQMKRESRESQKRVIALEKELRESRERVAELEQQRQSEGRSIKSDPDASSSDLANRALSRRLQDAEENRQMTETIAQQAQAQIQNMESLINGMREQISTLRRQNQKLQSRSRSSHVYDLTDE